MNLPRSPLLPGRRRHGESGAVLITVLLVMMALLGMGVMALWMTSGNLQIGVNTSLRDQALYVAEAGVEAVRQDLVVNGTTPAAAAAYLNARLLGGVHTWNDKPTGIGVDAGGRANGVGAIYFANSMTVPLTYVAGVPQASPCTIAPCALAGVVFPPTSFNRGSGGNLSTTMGSYTVWIRNDTAELRQGSTANPNLNIPTDNNGMVIVRSRGTAPDGRTQVTLEVSLGPGNTPTIPNPVVTGTPPVLCNAGKNACDENSSTQSGVVVQ
jgi:hypothetical protein